MSYVFLSISKLPSHEDIKFAILVRFVPSWFPGANLLKKAEMAKALIDRMVDEPYEQVKSQRVCILVY